MILAFWVGWLVGRSSVLLVLLFVALYWGYIRGLGNLAFGWLAWAWELGRLTNLGFLFLFFTFPFRVCPSCPLLGDAIKSIDCTFQVVAVPYCAVPCCGMGAKRGRQVACCCCAVNFIYHYRLIYYLLPTYLPPYPRACLLTLHFHQPMDTAVQQDRYFGDEVEIRVLARAAIGRGGLRGRHR